MTYENAKAVLKEKDQLQLLEFYHELPESEQSALLSQIETMNWGLLDLLKEKDKNANSRGHFEPLGALTVEEIDRDREKYEAAGLDAIRKGKVAACILAGGAGTRLGFDHAKGMYNVGLTRDLYIFECLVHNLLEVTDKAGALIPLFVMTSEKNNEETIAFFKEHNYFGYDADMVYFFVQAMAPCVGFDGKILLEEKGKVATSPDGNGGWFLSMKKAGFVDLLHEKNIEYISVFNVDNVLQRICDPAFVGATILSGRDLSAKVLKKAEPNERLGVLCLEDGKPSVAEYYEMTDDMINLRDENGELLYAFGSISNFLFKLNRLEEIVERKMVVHIVEKKVPYIDGNAVLIKPETPNAYKFEYLVLDMMHMMDSCLPYEVRRSYEFAPIKNPTGVDSVESARELLKLNGVEL